MLSLQIILLQLKENKIKQTEEQKSHVRIYPFLSGNMNFT